MIHKAWNGLEEVPSCFQGHLSIFKVTQEKKSLILTPFECFRTVALVWVHRWLWNDAQSLKQPRAGVLLFFKDICQILKLCGLEIADLDPILGRSQLSNPSGLPFLFRLQVSFNMDKIVCAVCFDRIRDCFLMPCGHTLCRPYATQIQETSRSCPHCRAIFTEIKELFPWIDFDLIHDIGRFVIFFEYLPGKVLVAPPLKFAVACPAMGVRGFLQNYVLSKLKYYGRDTECIVKDYARYCTTDFWWEALIRLVVFLISNEREQ